MTEQKKEEAQRQCPACRNWVSYLATRCHHCGETLGRPRKEELRITIEDLGGEQRGMYSVSGNVMDALEAFREENLSETEGLRRQKEEMSQTWFGKRSMTSDPPEGAAKGMPALDEEHQSLADAILGEIPSTRTPSPAAGRRPNPDLARNIAIGAGVLVAAGALYAFGWPAMQSYLESRNRPEEVAYFNRTPQLIAESAPALAVLQEARTAVDTVRNDENLAVLEQARAYAQEKVREMLNMREFNSNTLDEASALVNQLVRIDASDAMSKLADEVKAELAAHKLVLTSVEPDGTKATFKLNNPAAGVDEQTAGVGDLLADRFIVTAITGSSVRLEDTKRLVSGRQRPLVARQFRAVSGN